MSDLDSKTRSRLRSKAQGIETTIKVGKGGVTEPVIEELRNQATRRGLVKVGLLKSATYEEGRDPIAEELAEKAGVTLVEVRGNTAVYWKRGSVLEDERQGPSDGARSSGRGHKRGHGRGQGRPVGR